MVSKAAVYTTALTTNLVVPARGWVYYYQYYLKCLCLDFVHTHSLSQCEQKMMGENGCRLDSTSH